MRNIKNLCPKCFNMLNEDGACDFCDFNAEETNETRYLKERTILDSKYAVGLVKSIESDAVTYYGYDLQLDKKIIVREFYPTGIANRLEGNDIIHIRQKYVDEYDRLKRSFFKLWTTIEKLQGLSAIVPAYDVFEANGTAYAIIEAMDSIPLREYLLKNEEGYIQWDNARIMLMPVLTTIEALHSNGIIHGSITPDNLLLCRDGKVRLKPFTIQEACESKSVLEFNFTDGYTALEQYDNNHRICPATDIYAFSAVIYRALVGTNPPDAMSREANDKLMIPNSIAETIPMHAIKALGSGLQIYPEKRTRTIADFREQLDASPNIQAMSNNQIQDDAPAKRPAKRPAPQQQPPKKKKNTGSTIAIIVLIILIIGAIGAGIYIIKQNQDAQNQQVTESTVDTAEYEVPNFSNVGYTKSDVENNATWNDRFTITYVYEFSKDVEEGIIFEQSVKAGESVKAKSTIELTISKGVQTETVPDVSGLDFEEAKKKLEELGFAVSSVEIYNDGAHTKGQVKGSFASAPEAGSVVAVGTEVVLQVYGEVQTTEAPDDAGTD